MRELARWLGRRGVPAYVLPTGALPRPARYVPHIYTDQELAALFTQTDRCHYDSQVPFRHLVMPVLFRTIYACGLRASEARLLRFDDVDLDAGVLTIRDGKGGKDRQVPGQRRRCATGWPATTPASPGAPAGTGSSPAPPGSPLTIGNIDKNFRRFLWQARIPHGGRGHGPRVHDLRHAMAVNNLRSWFARGEDVGALLPVLQTYMGHSSIADTDYYLRLTAESYPHITARIQRAYGDVVPPVTEGRVMATDFAVFAAPLPHLAPGRAARLLTQHDRLLPRHLQAADRLVPRRQIHPARQDSPSTASTPPRSPGSSNWLEAERHNSISTRNQRLAAVSSFFRWLQSQDPTRMAGCQDILAIPAKRRPNRPSITSPSSRPAACSPSPTGPPGEAAATRPCWPPSTTPPPGSKNSPT